MERLAGLNVRSFNPTEVFTEIISHCLGQKCKKGAYIDEKIFMVLLKTVFSPANLSPFTVIVASHTTVHVHMQVYIHEQLKKHSG